MSSKEAKMMLSWLLGWSQDFGISRYHLVRPKWICIEKKHCLFSLSGNWLSPPCPLRKLRGLSWLLGWSKNVLLSRYHLARPKWSCIRKVSFLAYQEVRRLLHVQRKLRRFSWRFDGVRNFPLFRHHLLRTKWSCIQKVSFLAYQLIRLKWNCIQNVSFLAYQEVRHLFHVL